jgi:penicillin-binding protein 2
MKLNRSIPLAFLLTFLVVLLGCAQAPTPGGGTPNPSAAATTPSLAPPQVTSIAAPDAKAAAKSFLDGWKAEDYNKMYALLTKVSQDAISKDQFTKHFKGIAAEAALTGVDYQLLSSLVINPEASQVGYRVTLHSLLVGDVSRDTLMNLSREKDDWRIQWDDTLVMPELQGGNYLAMDREGFIPARANIYDRQGKALVAQSDATAIGLYPDNIEPDQADALFGALTSLTGLSSDAIQGMYANFPKGGGWYLPLGEVSADKIGRRYDTLSGLGGLVLQSYKARYYFGGGVAPHVVGYVSAIQPDEVEAYKRKGYRQDERVGRSGLEKWGEQYLSGQRGGALYVFNAKGQPVTRLAEQAAKPSQSIYTTIDRDLQDAAQKSLRGFNGAVVILERDTGRVLAMASSPNFDPNAFEPVNYNSATLLGDLNNTDKPLYNRASRGQYPLGSVFKIITMATALESGSYTPDSTYQCGYTFDEVTPPLYDWTWEHFQNDRKTQPSGLLTLSGGLIKSCNPWFYHIGLDLYNRGLIRSVTDMAKSFGLGSKTGIEAVEEEAGGIPVPGSALDATNNAIGQGATLVSPLQVADFVAAVGNGGTLYVPQVIEKVAPPDGAPSKLFAPKERAKLPLKPETLKAIQDAMRGVVEGTKPRGTAQHVFTGINLPVFGKTGTATSGSGLPHAWFAGYTDAQRKDKPDIAMAVVIENIGEGSDYAAPVFRRLVEVYFRGAPGKLLPWESNYYTTKTPTPPDTPAP